MPDQAQLVIEIREMLKSLNVDVPTDEAGNAVLDGHLHLDSMMLLDLIVMFEKKYGLVLDDAEMGQSENFESLGSLIDLVLRKL